MANITGHGDSPSPSTSPTPGSVTPDTEDASKFEASATKPAEDVRATTPVDASTKGNTGAASPIPGAFAQEEEPTPPLPTHPTDVPETEYVSPEAMSLKAMFPDFDVIILQSVLDSVGGDQERATDVLLGMSDPSYVPQHQPAPSQTDLDEQLARRLAFEDQQQQAAWHPDQQYPFAGQDGERNRPYQPRVQGGAYQGGRQGQGQGQWGDASQGGGGRDTMAEVQEQFSKIAETGKKTFSSLFTKVKAKMQEFDQSRNSPGSASQTSWGYGTPSGAMSASQGQNYQPFSSSQPQAQYYAPASAQAREPRRDDYGHQGYDASPAAQQPSPAAVTESSVPVARAAAAVPAAERIPPRPTSTGPPPVGNVDPTKIGMLPKRPVSLLGSNPQASPTLADEEDELDYVENPFEDRSK